MLWVSFHNAFFTSNSKCFTQKLAINIPIKQENLKPDMEEKLSQLQQYEAIQIKQKFPEVLVGPTRLSIRNTFNRSNAPRQKQPLSPSTNDNEGTLETKQDEIM